MVLKGFGSMVVWESFLLKRDQHIIPFEDFQMYIAVIPAFNEEKSIGNVVNQTRKYVGRVVVVDDASSDNTREMAQRSGAIVLQHSKNGGVGAAMITGIEYMQKLKPDIVVTLDGDGQHCPSDIPRLIRPIIEGRADWVIGSRFLQRLPEKLSLIKYLGNKFLTFITNILTGVKLTDTQSGFRAFNREALLALDLTSKFTYTQEMILILSHKGFRGAEVPIATRPRRYGNSKVASNLVKYGFRSLVIILSTYSRQKING
jgi:glycosyltransferase involved in cell wall biosynthesis